MITKALFEGHEKNQSVGELFTYDAKMSDQDLTKPLNVQHLITIKNFRGYPIEADSKVKFWI